MSPIQQLLLTSGGASKKTYVDDLFSTQLWIGDAGTNRSINNGIDLSGEGGMVWFKRRNAEGANHTVYDTVRTATKALYLNSNDFGNTLTNGLKSFNSNGFTIGNNGNNNTSNNPYVAYSFRKAPGFFDVVTWTGNQTANRKISHSLGSVPGAIFIKRLGGSQGTNVSDWICYNRGSDSEQYPQNFLQFLNRNVGASNDGAGNYLYNVAPTADEFTIGSHFTVNASGNDYIAYVFAHDDQQFGEDGDESIIKCGYYGGNGSNNGTVVNLGWEPQWVLIKRNNNSEDWMLFDSMRGVATDNYDTDFRVNSATADATNRDWLDFQPRGFQLKSAWDHVNASGSRYIYIAIRAATGTITRPPEAGTDVFAMDTGAGSSTIPNFDSGFPVDFAFARQVASSASWDTSARLIGTNFLRTEATSAQGTSANFTWDSNVGWNKHSNYNSGAQSWMWKRGAGFDVVTQKITTESGYPSYNHNLGVVPEMIWSKRRDGVSDWTVYHKGLNGGTNAFNWRVRLNENAAQYEDTYLWGLNSYPTATAFTSKGASFAIGDHIFLLFASVDKISKVGSYTGTGSGTSGHQINLGFTPRFLVIKNASSTSNWLTLDALRGLDASGNENYLLLSSTGAQVSVDWVNTTSTGFNIVSSGNHFNDSGSTFIYYAHA